VEGSGSAQKITHPGGPKLTDPDRIRNTVSLKLEHLKKELRIYNIGNFSRVSKSKYVDKASSFKPKRAKNVNTIDTLAPPPLTSFLCLKIKNER
jgi:hypothetical protein